MRGKKVLSYSWENAIFVREKQKRSPFFLLKIQNKILSKKKKEVCCKNTHLEARRSYLITVMISSCSKVRCCLGQYLTPLLIFHDQGFTGSKFHSSSLQILCFRQELAGNTIAPRRCDLLWGKPRLIMIISSGFLGSWGQTLCSHIGKDPLNKFIHQMKTEWFIQAYSQQSSCDLGSYMLIQKTLDVLIHYNILAAHGQYIRCLCDFFSLKTLWCSWLDSLSDRI